MTTFADTTSYNPKSVIYRHVPEVDTPSHFGFERVEDGARFTVNKTTAKVGAKMGSMVSEAAKKLRKLGAAAAPAVHTAPAAPPVAR